MPWPNATTAPFSRIGIVAGVPSDSGVYGIFRGDSCMLVGDTWNLKARLLELISTIPVVEELVVGYELCSESKAAELSASLQRELVDRSPVVTPMQQAGQDHGIRFWVGGAGLADPNSPEA